MKSGFTLIELLVVMVILTVIMGLVVPSGSRMLSSFEKSIQNIKDKHMLSLQIADAFIGAKDTNISLAGGSYRITKKGLLVKDETINDND